MVFIFTFSLPVTSTFDPRFFLLVTLVRHYVSKTLRRCYVNYTGFLFGGEWSSNSPVRCARHCAIKCLSTWLMTSISSPKATDDSFGLPLITRARCHVRTTALETAALALSAHEFGTVCHVAYGHLTSATNILMP